MSISIDLDKVNYNDFINQLMKNSQIADKELLEKIVLEFGNKVGEDLVVLSNEYYETGHCLWNMFHMIEEVFGLDDKDYASDVWYNLRKGLIDYKEIDEAYENLGLERKEIED